MRGLDYYTHTAFEFVTSHIGAQGTVLGGGRYDGLIAELGGPPTAGIGWAGGIERLVMLCNDPAPLPRAVVIAPLGAAAEAKALGLARALRRPGIAVEQDYRGNMKRRMQRANKLNARAAADHRRRRARQGRCAAQGPRQRRAARSGAGCPGRCAEGLRFDVSLLQKLDQISARHAELQASLSGGNLDSQKFVAASKEYSDLGPLVEAIGEWRKAETRAEGRRGAWPPIPT